MLKKFFRFVRATRPPADDPWEDPKTEPFYRIPDGEGRLVPWPGRRRTEPILPPVKPELPAIDGDAPAAAGDDDTDPRLPRLSP
jgi:hypothetical protein